MKDPFPDPAAAPEAATGPRLPRIEPADIDWQDGLPVSRQFGDVYFSRDNGLEESRYVFLNHNALPQRFADLGPGDSFVVAESGFGTGLNFLATWQAWRHSVPETGEDSTPSPVLHFVSVERYPLDITDLTRALMHWEELRPLADQLISNYPPLAEGCHRLIFEEGRVRLTLVFGDALESWRDMTFQADAWFLDGFAPACNPELWQQALIQEIRRHSHQGTTLATFTAVGWVRRSLADAGFTMKKVPGYGRKREMLTGSLELPEAAAEPLHAATNKPAHVAIVGAGIAGALLARNLAGRGIRVTVIERAGPASGASGNPQGALYVKLAVDYNEQARLALAALLHAQRFYPVTTPQAWHGTGLLMLATNSREQQRQQKFLRCNDYPAAILQAVSPEQASEISGLDSPWSGLWFPASGWLNPADAVRQLLDHPRIQFCPDFPVERIHACGHRWRLSSAGQTDILADQVVVAAGHRVTGLDIVSPEFRFRMIRGQITRLPETALTRSPKVVITGDKYLNPPDAEGRLVTGATFDLGDPDPEIRNTSHQENLQGLEQMLPGIFTAPPAGIMDGRVSFRCTTHDYQPVAGHLVNEAGEAFDGLWMLTGLGSKGLTWGPLLAEFLADRISRQPEALFVSAAGRVAAERCLRPRGQR